MTSPLPPPGRDTGVLDSGGSRNKTWSTEQAHTAAVSSPLLQHLALAAHPHGPAGISKVFKFSTGIFETPKHRHRHLQGSQVPSSLQLMPPLPPGSVRLPRRASPTVFNPNSRSRRLPSAAPSLPYSPSP